MFQVVKVCDFGVARLKPPSLNTAEKSEKFSAEMTAETGTYRWMSPEVRMSNSGVSFVSVFEV